MTGLDLLAILFVIFLTAAIVRQHRIDQHDRERQQSRNVVKNILRATGGRQT